MTLSYPWEPQGAVDRAGETTWQSREALCYFAGVEDRFRLLWSSPESGLVSTSRSGFLEWVGLPSPAAGEDHGAACGTWCSPVGPASVVSAMWVKQNSSQRELRVTQQMDLRSGPKMGL